MTSCRIESCEAGGNGGAIATGASASIGFMTLTDCQLDNNEAGGDGGAIFKLAAGDGPAAPPHRHVGPSQRGRRRRRGIWFASAEGLLDMDNSLIAWNQAGGTGGAIHQEGGNLEITGGGGAGRSTTRPGRPATGST